jgi:decaprenylphospho-beta-D-ribofuranose 2-oxidase
MGSVKSPLSGWGRYPSVEARVIRPASIAKVSGEGDTYAPDGVVARGLGRSYGDSALADCVVDMTSLDYLLEFDEENGLLTCCAGVSLAEILRVFVPRGWFLPVTPGTKYVTVGGAIASDVHGKNHHIDGCFSAYIHSLKIATVSEGLLECSREQHTALFHATCGGMGLTGIIVSATLQLRPISSAYIQEVTLKTRNLEETFEQFEQHKGAHYSVAWIDCLSRGRALGRSLLMLGEHAKEGGCVPAKASGLNVPIDFPGFVLNPYSVRTFNTLYYHRVMRTRSERKVHYEPFFYPLDGIKNWNRMYGAKGFLQYQFVLPLEAGLAGMTEILQRIVAFRRGSFLSVLKVFGEENMNLLSFPMRGYTLALDFKFDTALPGFLNELDHMVTDFGGRIYLTKDARMSEATFKHSYPRWEEFVAVRERYAAHQRFHSLQSKRLGL